jgi:hypothetical protein
LNAGLYGGLLKQPFLRGDGRGSDVLTLVSDESSLSTQSSTALLLAHRAQLNLLPEVGEADTVLIDLFSPVDQPREEPLTSVAQKMFSNPDYGIRAESGGVILFSRDSDPSHDIDRLARAAPDEIQYPSNVILGETILYRGFSMDRTSLVPGQPFVITTYWESLDTVQRPYLLFSAYPGGQQFQEAVFGLYPVALWQPGDLVRHRFAITLPQLPPGQDYEIVVGLWFDIGEPALTQPSQLLGEDVVRIARILVTDNLYEIQAWDAGGSN